MVCDINHQGIQHKLLSEGDISYTYALALAQSIESAEDDAKKLGGSPSLQPAYYTQKEVKVASSRTPPTCYHCGSLHLAPACPHKEKVCRTAKRKALAKTGCTVLRLALLQKVALQPLLPRQIRSPLRRHTTSKSSQNKRIILVGMNTVSMPLMMNILLHSPSPSISTIPQS